MLFSRARWLVRSRPLAKNQRRINKMAPGSGDCCTTYVFGSLVIQLVWHILKQ